MYDFLPQQKQALEQRGNITVSAGAGSGKTRVLVEKYFRLLADEHPDWPVQSVTAITFTIKAASELKSRIIERINAERESGAVGGRRALRLAEMRRELAAAPIGTIHNFCSRILRHYALRAGLSPDFRIVEGAEQLAIRSEAVEKAVAQAASIHGSRDYEDLLQLLTVYSRTALTGLLDSMIIRRAEFLTPAKRFVALEHKTLVDELRDFHRKEVQAKRQELLDRVEAVIGTLTTSCPKLPPELMRAAQGILAAAAAGSWDGICSNAELLSEGLFTKQATVRKTIESCTGLHDTHALAVQIMDFCNAAGRVKRGDITLVDIENIEISQALSRLFLKAEGIYGQLRSSEMNDSELLDFTDLELLSEKLLSEHADVRAELRSRLRYLIIDEFQDTSEVQWRILGRLVSDESGALLDERLFVVGDPKQSVYGFRQAEHRIFRRVRQLTAETNSAAGREESGVVSVPYNFRTLPRPLAFVNTLFEALAEEHRTEHDVEFEPLESRRQGSEGHVEMLIVVPDAEPPDADHMPADCPEAEVIAERIKLMIAEQGYAPADFAILFRKRKFFTAYEQALRRRGIAFLTHRGRGLFEQPEVMDLLAVLRLLNSTGSDPVTAQVMRGSLFNFSDDLLLKISLFSGESFYEKMSAACEQKQVTSLGVTVELTNNDLQRICFLRGIVTELRPLVGSCSVSRLLMLIIERTGAILIAGAGERGEQAAANIERLLAVARRSPGNDLELFLNFIDAQLLSPGDEGEASSVAHMAAVKLMTVHAAKGLEFPVVFLPELADPFRPRKDELVNDGARWLASSKCFSGGEYERIFLHEYLNEEERARSASEERRILYVAATRCRNELYLVSVEPEKRSDSVYRWILENVPMTSTGMVNGSTGFVLPFRRVSAPVVPLPPIGKVTLHAGGFESRSGEMENRLICEAGGILETVPQVQTADGRLSA